MSTLEQPDAKRLRSNTACEGAASQSEQKCKEPGADSPAVTVHVVRHGQVDNPNSIFYGRLPGFDLHVDGREQARQAGRYLVESISEPSSTLVLASPMLRAQTTAKLIAGVIGVEDVRTEEDINEVHCPHDGKPISEMAALNWQIYGCGAEWESFEDVGGRVMSALKRIAAEVLRDAQGGLLNDVVLVSHGDPVAISRLWGMGRDINLTERTRLQEEGYPSYCSLTSLRIDGDGRCLSIAVHDVVTASPDGKKV